MIDHIGLRTRDLARAKAFYSQALAPLGYALIMELPPEHGSGLGFGAGRKPDFWVGLGEPVGPVHVAILAPDRAAVDAFHAAALAAGATDNGSPGPRPHYHAAYYGAFVIDPDGNNLEAVCHSPP